MFRTCPTAHEQHSVHVVGRKDWQCTHLDDTEQASDGPTFEIGIRSVEVIIVNFLVVLTHLDSSEIMRDVYLQI